MSLSRRSCPEIEATPGTCDEARTAASCRPSLSVFLRGKTMDVYSEGFVVFDVVVSSGVPDHFGE
jgi:hypothetical protein